jgi:MoaA/NifB/PqqE/SkfB family radical SAM enzyme
MQNLDTAKQHIADKDYKQALSLLLQLYHADKNSLSISLELVNLYLFLQKQNEAVKILKELIDNKIYNNNIIELFLKYCRKEDTAYIYIIENAVFQNEAGQGKVLFELGKYYINKDKNKAVNFLTLHCKKNDEDINAALLLSKLHKEQGNEQLSKEVLSFITTEGQNIFEYLHKVMSEPNIPIEKKLKNIKMMLEKFNLPDIDFLYAAIFDFLIDDYLINKSGEAPVADFISTYINTLNTDYKVGLAKKISLYYKSFGNLFMAIQTLACAVCEDKSLNTAQLFYAMLREIKFDKKQEAEIIRMLNYLIEKTDDIKLKNIFLNEIEILKKQTVLQSKPRQMQVLLTTNCNIKCIMCDVCRHDMTIDESAIKLVKDYMPYLEKIMWTGGEVFLYKNFRDLVELASRYNVKQSFITNGLLLTDDDIQLIGNNNISFAISIDATDKKLYERIRAGADFDKLLSVLSKLANYKNNVKHIDYKMTVVVMSVNYDKIKPMIDFAIKYGFTSILFQQYIPYHDKSLKLSNEQAETVKRQVKEFKNQFKNRNIPIEIITKYNLEENDNDEKKIINDNNTHIDGHCVNNSPSPCGTNRCDAVAYSCKKVFCVAPWESMFLSPDCMQFSSYCKPIQAPLNENLWNSGSLSTFRKNIAQDKLYAECDICKQMGDIAENARLGKK